MIFAICAQAAIAGPWLREAGSGFFSTSTKFGLDLHAEQSVYAEYGLRPDLTLGALIDLPIAGPAETTALLFFRQPIGSGEGPMVYAYDLGLGMREDQIFARGGFSLGRGIKLGERYGWAVLDNTLDISSTPRIKSDGTVGLNLSNRWKAMLQGFFQFDETGSTLTIAPSVVYSPKHIKTSFQVGIEFGEDDPDLRIGIWRDF
jgi:hypothetical protein